MNVPIATTEFSTTYMMTYTAHTTPVNAVMWNSFHPTIFMSCAAEYTVNIWHKDFCKPVLKFDFGSQVGDVSWAPYSSTVNIDTKKIIGRCST